MNIPLIEEMLCSNIVLLFSYSFPVYFYPSNIGLTLNASIGAILASLYVAAPALHRLARSVTIAL